MRSSSQRSSASLKAVCTLADGSVPTKRTSISNRLTVMTVTYVESAPLSSVPRIQAVPGPTPATTPADVTVATSVSVDTQVAVGPRISVP